MTALTILSLGVSIHSPMSTEHRFLIHQWYDNYIGREESSELGPTGIY